jgi:hypothetical protein
VSGEIWFWLLVILLAAGFLLAFIYLTTRRQHRRLLQPLTQVLDEHSGEVRTESFLAGSSHLAGQFQGRRVTLALAQSPGGSEKVFQIGLSGNSPLAFEITKGTFTYPSVGKRLKVGEAQLDKEFKFSCSHPSGTDSGNILAHWVMLPNVRGSIETLFHTHQIRGLHFMHFGNESGLGALHVTYGGHRKKDASVANVERVLEIMTGLVYSLETLA